MDLYDTDGWHDDSAVDISAPRRGDLADDESLARRIGWAFAGELVTARMLAAAAVIVGGVAIITVARAAELPTVAEEGIGD